MSIGEITKILGIDYGRSDVGLALADAETRIAYAYGKIKNDKQLLDKIVAIIEKENVKIVVIGIPSHVNREVVEYDGERIGKAIQKMVAVEVAYCNEMFTTKMAQHNLIEKGVKGIKRFDDQEAARIILQLWLDETGESSVK